MPTSRTMMKMTPEDAEEHQRLLDAISEGCNADPGKPNGHQDVVFRYLRRRGRKEEEIQSMWFMNFDHPRPRYRSFGPSGWRNIGPDDNLNPQPYVPGGIGRMLAGLDHDVMEFYQVQQLAELAMFDVQDWVNAVQRLVEDGKSISTSADAETLNQHKSRLQQLAGGDRMTQVTMVANVANTAYQRRCAIHELLLSSARVRQEALSDEVVSLLVWLDTDSTRTSFWKENLYLTVNFPRILESLLKYQTFLEQCEGRLETVSVPDVVYDDEEDSDVDGKDKPHADEEGDGDSDDDDDKDFHDAVADMSKLSLGDQVQDEVSGDTNTSST